MSHDSLSVIVLIITIVATIACVAAFKSLAKNCYRKTGVNVLRGLNKLLWYAQIGVTAFLSQGTETASAGLPILIVCVLAFIVIQTLVNIKAGTKYAVISGVMHGTCGMFLALINIVIVILTFSFKMMFGLSIPGGLFDIDTTKKMEADSAVVFAQAEADNKRAEQEAKEVLADKTAKGLGFRDADDAERAGIHTGKYD